MATPAAVLSILVKTQGAQAAAAQLGSIDATARKASGGLAKTEASSKRLSGSLSTMKTAAISAGAAVGIAGLAAGVKSAVDEFREAQKTGAQTNAVLKSTKGAANVTAKEIGNLATAISKKSGIDDEQIQQSENMLLTFTKVRNETGKGNKIFDQATQTVTDMSVALGQSGKTSAIQLGKALNDPIKGVTALQRVGVTFDAQQKKQIATMVKSGDTLGAQKVILGELNKEFSGSAAAQATAGDKLKVTLGNLAEIVGGVLVPAFDKAAAFVTKLLNEMMSGTGTGGQIITTFKNIAAAATPFIQSIQQIVQWLGKHEQVAKVLAIGLGILTAAVIALNIAVSANPFVLAGIAIAALVVGVVTAYREFATFRNIVDTVAHAVASAFPAIKAGFDAVVSAVRAALPTLAAVAKSALAAFTAVFRAVWPVIKGIFSGGITALRAIVRGGAQVLSGAVDVIKGVLSGDFGEIWTGIKKIFTGGFTALKGIITGAATALGTAAKTIGTAIIDAIVDAIKAGGQKVVTAVKGVLGDVKGAVKGAIGSVNPFGDGIGVSPIAPLPGAGNLMGASKALGPFAAVGSAFGLHVSSGRRPGAITSSGNVSYHASGRAIDLANGRGPDASKLAAFKALKSRYGSQLAELIYTPGGVGIKDGKPFRYTGAVAAQHMDHVHVAFTGGGTGDGIGRARAAFAGDGIGDVARLAKQAGFKGDALTTAIAVAGAESGFRSKASNRNSNGSIDRGYWQINSVHGAQSTFSPTGNARAAFNISSGGRNWHPWVTYNTGAYQRYLNQARAAAGSISGSATKSKTGGATSSAGSGAASAVAKVNPLDQKLAAADLSIQQAQTGKASTRTFQKVAAMVAKRKLLGRRITSIRKALKGKLSPTKRLALTQELTQRLQEHAQLGTDIQGLVHPAATAADTTIAGGDAGGAAGGDPNQALIDSNAALADKLQAAADAYQAHQQQIAGLQAEVKRTNDIAAQINASDSFQMKKWVTDVISSQIAGSVTAKAFTPGTGVEWAF